MGRRPNANFPTIGARILIRGVARRRHLFRVSTFRGGRRCSDELEGARAYFPTPLAGLLLFEDALADLSDLDDKGGRIFNTDSLFGVLGVGA